VRGRPAQSLPIRDDPVQKPVHGERHAPRSRVGEAAQRDTRVEITRFDTRDRVLQNPQRRQRPAHDDKMDGEHEQDAGARDGRERGESRIAALQAEADLDRQKSRRSENDRCQQQRGEGDPVAGDLLVADPPEPAARQGVGRGGASARPGRWPRSYPGLIHSQSRR
jgi:hypothetical protein